MPMGYLNIVTFKGSKYMLHMLRTSGRLKQEMHTHFQSEMLKERDHFEDLEVE
jgi:hypothetical protein